MIAAGVMRLTPHASVAAVPFKCLGLPNAASVAVCSGFERGPWARATGSRYTVTGGTSVFRYSWATRKPRL